MNGGIAKTWRLVQGRFCILPGDEYKSALAWFASFITRTQVRFATRLQGGENGAARVAMVATTGPWGVGGLAAYERNLLSRFPVGTTPTCSVRFVADGTLALDYAAREEVGKRWLGDVAVATVAPSAFAAPMLRAASRLVHHPTAHRTVIAIAVLAWRRPLAATLSHQATIIHSVGCGRELLGFAALAEARRRGIPFTLWPAVHINSWGDSRIDVALYRGADAIFVQTWAEREHLERLGIAPERLVVCGLGPDCRLDGSADAFRARPGVGNRPLVLFIGRKTRSKGYHRLCESMAALCEKIPDALLVVIGADSEPPYPSVASEAFLDLGMADEVTKADALAACDVLCVPSSSEAFGIVYVEAWAYRKPVVALDTPASRSLISPSVTGLLVAEEKMGLVDALYRLLSDNALREAIGHAGHDVYRKRYTWDVTLETHLRTFSSLSKITT